MSRLKRMFAILLALMNFFRKTQYKKPTKVIATAASMAKFQKFARARRMSIGANPQMPLLAVTNTILTVGRQYRICNMKVRKPKPAFSPPSTCWLPYYK